MQFRSVEQHTSIACGIFLVLLGIPAAAQDTPQDPPEPADRFEAIRAWEADPSDAERRAEAVRVATDAGLAGIERLRRGLDAVLERAQTEPAATAQIRAAASTIVRDVALRYLDVVEDSEMQFAGQYAPLQPMQPWIGRVYLQLILETPEWYPVDRRARIVPALRDLLPAGPTTVQLDRLRDIAQDREGESQDLRIALSFALAQWGDRSLVQPQIAELTASAGEGKSSDELYFLRRLALVHYFIREYETSGSVWRRYLRGREELGDAPAPFDYYNAACSLSLAGEIPLALEELERCCALLRGETVDESQRVQRKLFDTDPELRAVRSTRQFQEMVEKTFVEKRK